MLTSVVILMNRACTVIARVLLVPIAWLPGWLSLGIIGAVTGIAMLWIFKHTSNQAAIRKTRNQIAHNKLALSLFSDNLWIGLRSQGAILAAAGRLLILAIPPLLVMAVPMVLLLGQLGQWYQSRPLHVDEEAIVTLQMDAGKIDSTAPQSIPEPQLIPSPAIDVTIGPVRVPSKQMICWNIVPRRSGVHSLQFQVGDQTVVKELAVGNGFMPVSVKRPGPTLEELLLHPIEKPFPTDSVVRSIDISYPDRTSLTSGTNWWIVYWFLVSLCAALVAKPLLNVNL